MSDNVLNRPSLAGIRGLVPAQPRLRPTVQVVQPPPQPPPSAPVPPANPFMPSAEDMETEQSEDEYQPSECSATGGTYEQPVYGEISDADTDDMEAMDAEHSALPTTESWHLPPPVDATERQKRMAAEIHDACNLRQAEEQGISSEETGDAHHDQASRRRIAMISRNAAPDANGRVPPARSKGDAQLRKAISEPVTRADLEALYENDELFMLTRPVPGKARRRLLTIKVDESDEEDSIENKQKADTKPCYGCFAGLLSDSKPANKSLQKVIDVFHNHRATSTPETLALMMHTKYAEVRKEHNMRVNKYYQQGFKHSDEVVSSRMLPAWKLKDVYEHLTDHMIVNPDAFALVRMRQLNELADHCYHNGLYLVDPARPHAVIVNHRATKTYFSAISMELRLRTSLTKKMNYASTSISIKEAPDIVAPVHSISLKTKKRPLHRM